MAYSKYAQAERDEYQHRFGQKPDVNYVGMARTRNAARQGRRRIAGYSHERQGGRDAARQRAEDRKTGAFKRLSAARNQHFGGLKEFDAMQDPNRFNRKKGDGKGGLNDYYAAQNNPKRVRPVSSVKSAAPVGPIGPAEPVGDANPMNNRVNIGLGAADFPSDVAGFDDVKKGQKGPFNMLTVKGRVKGYATR
jgi:hypothetical protein